MIEDGVCCFCKKEMEGVNHVLLQCYEIWKVWSDCLRWWGLKWVVPRLYFGFSLLVEELEI